MSPRLSDAIVCRKDGVKQLVSPARGTVYRALSAEAATAYGLSPVFLVHDELGVVRCPRSELFEVLETVTSAQLAPLSIIISTQAPTDTDLLSILLDDALSGHNPHTVCLLHAAPADAADPFSLAAGRSRRLSSGGRSGGQRSCAFFRIIGIVDLHWLRCYGVYPLTRGCRVLGGKREVLCSIRALPVSDRSGHRIAVQRCTPKKFIALTPPSLTTALARYCDVGFAPATAERVLMSDKPYVFISYARADFEPVRRIVEELNALGVDTWTDVKNLSPGEVWRNAIDLAIRRAEAFVVFMSPESLRSKWIVRDRGIRIIPVLLYPLPVSELSPRLAAIQWVDISGYPPESAAKEAASEIARAVLRLKSTTSPAELPDRQRENLAAALAAQVRDQPEQPKKQDEKSPNSIFIVHGHDEEFLREVEAFLVQAGIKPIIMKDAGGASASLIQKFFEVGRAAEFAIVLLSGDDMGASRIQYEMPGVGVHALKYRTRQNVALELEARGSPPLPRERSRFRSILRIACMPEIVECLGRAEASSERTDPATQARNGSRSGLAQVRLEFAERHLDRIQVR